MIQQLMNSFKHFFNKHDIDITSWEGVKNMVITIMSCVYKQ